MTMTLLQESLAKALRAARVAAEAVAEGDDGGTANLDQPFLFAKKGLKCSTMETAAFAAGVEVSRHRSRMWNGWFLHVTAGQGARRTRMAEAAVSALNAHGQEACVYYQID